MTFIFRKKLYLGGKYAVPKLATDAKRRNVSGNYEDRKSQIKNDILKKINYYIVCCAFILNSCSAEYFNASVNSNSSWEVTVFKQIKKKSLLRRGWRKFNNEKYSRSLKLGLDASKIHAAHSLMAEPAELEFSTYFLLTNAYFKLNQFDSALCIIHDLVGAFSKDQQFNSFDSLEIKIFSKMLTCETLKHEIDLNIDSISFGHIFTGVIIPLKSYKQNLTVHLNYSTKINIFGAKTFSTYEPPTKEQVANFKAYFFNTNMYKNIWWVLKIHFSEFFSYKFEPV